MRTIENVKVKHARKVLNNLWSTIVYEARMEEGQYSDDYRLSAIDDLDDDTCVMWIAMMLQSGYSLVGYAGTPSMRD